MSADAAFAIVPLRGLEGRLVAHDWAWAEANAAAVEAHWARRSAERPGLFDGTVLLSCACAVADGVCTVDLFPVRYARFLAYRDAGAADGTVRNAFAALVPWSADGAVLLGVMGAHTANAGQTYFPCGTPDLDDVRGGRVDLAGSADREFAEETGLAPPDGARGGWAMLADRAQVAFLRPVRVPLNADEMAARVEAHRLRDPEPELAGTRIVRGPADIDPARMPAFARAYLEAAFAPGAEPALRPA